MNTNANASRRRHRYRRYRPALLGAIVLAAIALAALVFAIPAPAAHAQQGGSLPVFWSSGAAPGTPYNLTADYSYRAAPSSIAVVRLRWAAGQGNRMTVLCLPVCTIYSESGPSRTYVVQSRQPVQMYNGKIVKGSYDWRDLSGQALTAAYYNDQRIVSADDRAEYYPRYVEYRAKACNDHGCSGWTDAVRVQLDPPAPQPPDAPAGLTLTGTTLSWTAPGGDVASYEIHSRQQGRLSPNGFVIAGTDWSRLATIRSSAGSGAPPTRTDDAQPHPDAATEYRVRACNDSGCSGWSNTVVQPAAGN